LQIEILEIRDAVGRELTVIVTEFDWEHPVAEIVSVSI